MKKFKKLIPALALLLVSAVLMSTASYAWFSMNNKVTVTGMEVKTKVSSNMLIAHDTLANTSKKNDSDFTTSDSTAVKAILEPVSTADGNTFFYSTNAKADGSKITDSSATPFIQYNAGSSAVGSDASNYDDLFSQNYGVTNSSGLLTGVTKASPYVDYVFQLKAQNNGSGTQVISLTKLDLTYSGAADTSKAYRVAIFVEDITTNDPAGTIGTLKGVYKPESATNFNSQVVNGTDSYATATYVSEATSLASLNAGDNKQYKVVVRMWLEGQDTTCYNDKFIELTDSWKLDLELSLLDNETGVVYITQKVTPAP